MKKRKPTVPNKRQLKINKLADYKKFLQDDEDWDWAYIIRLLKYKLQRTRNCISRNNIIENAPIVAKQIREVEVLLERVEKNNYFWQISNGFRKKYGRLKMISEKPLPGKNYSAITFKFAKETPRNSKSAHAQHHQLWIKAEKMQRDDLKKAFELMHKNIWNWWD